MKELLCQLPDQGIISVIGSGGKTTCIRVLANLLPGKKLLCTTTHIFPFSEYPQVITDPASVFGNTDQVLDEISGLFSMHSVVCTGSVAASGKLRAPSVSFSALQSVTDYILVEADGSKCLPLKAHRDTEPVIPEGSSYTICVTGLSGMNRPIKDVCHCPDLFCQLTDSSSDAIATPARIASLLNQENLADFYLCNQADSASDQDIQTLLSMIHKPGLAVSLTEYLP